MEEKAAVLALPRSSEVGAPALGFLEGRFLAREDLQMATDLASEIDRTCSQTEADLHGLTRKLGSSVVSWSSRSIHARASAHNLTIALENLCLRSSKRLDSDQLVFVVLELKRIKALREYAECALKLEALVGDLEDAMLCALDPHTDNDSFGKNANVLMAVEAINIVEDLLLNVTKFYPHWRRLLETVDSRIDKILAVLRPQVVADHRGVLASLGWPPKVSASRIEGGIASPIPNPLVLMQRDKREKYSQSFRTLCALQHAQKRRDDRLPDLSGRKKDGCLGLWAMDELASPIASMVEHHFLKWVDQPELIFALVYKIIRDFIEGIDDVLQPLIDRVRLVNCSAKEAWVSSVVRFLSDFLAKRVFPVLVAGYKDKDSKESTISDWLHLMDNIIAFDKRVRSLLRAETCLFLGESETFLEASTNMGISVLSLFHDRPHWLRTWAKFEVKDAWKKLKSELKQERAWLTDENQGDETADRCLLSSREDFMAPLIAEFALKIAWHLVERCQTLPIMSARVQFIRAGAVKFLWHFFNVLLLRFQKTELNAYLSEATLVRACRLINAARFCESKLQEWSDDVNFLELAASETGMGGNSCFFKDEIRCLAELQTNWLSEVVVEIIRQFESYSFEYLEGVQHFEQANGCNAAPAVSDDLGESLDNLRGQILLIRKHLNPRDFSDFWRSVADGLDVFVFRSIISNNANFFSRRGADQLETDLQGLFLVFGTLCRRPEAFFPCIRDLLRALKLGREDARCLESFVGMDEGKARKWLLAVGISSISIDQVLMVLSRILY